MNFLEERIIKDGKLYENSVLKVDSFLNHQIDIEVLDKIGKVFYDTFKDSKIDKIVTIESSGIAIAMACANYFKVPVVFAKKSQSINIGDDVYESEIYSFTHHKMNRVIVAKGYIKEGEKILVVDDFLANGCALLGLISIIEQAGANVCGIGIAIEKGFQPGGSIIREKGYNLKSVAIVDSIDDKTNTITFKNQEVVNGI